MRSFLDALQAGRLIELPDNNKEQALRLLANLIEAIPEQHSGKDVADAVDAREKVANTGLGMGWACPHARIPGEGDLFCALGWSPIGIDYNAPDGCPVRMVAMYLVPENQRNVYLKEVSMLAKSLQANAGFRDVSTATDLNEIRNRLLDLVGTALEANVPDSRARMIRLEARQAATQSVPTDVLAGLTILPLSLVVGSGFKPIVLSNHREMVEAVETRGDIAEQLARRGLAEVGDWRIILRGATNYSGDRIVYDCLVVRAAAQPPVPVPIPAPRPAC